MNISLTNKKNNRKRIQSLNPLLQSTIAKRKLKKENKIIKEKRMLILNKLLKV